MKRLNFSVVIVAIFTMAIFLPFWQKEVVKSGRIPDLLMEHEDSPIVYGERTIYISLKKMG